jgi:hypothetical protein
MLLFEQVLLSQAAQSDSSIHCTNGKDECLREMLSFTYTNHVLRTKMPDYPYIVLSALAFLLNIAPFCWQAEHRNSGPVCLGFWVIVLNLNNFVSHEHHYYVCLSDS